MDYRKASRLLHVKASQPTRTLHNMEQAFVEKRKELEKRNAPPSEMQRLTERQSELQNEINRRGLNEGK